jgi:hypothetical protein
LRDTILQAVKQQELRGGPTWAEERLIGRVTFLARELGAPIGYTDSLDVLEAHLKPHADEYVRAGAGFGPETFSIKSLLDDIAALRAAKKHNLDPWWIRLGWNQTEGPPDDQSIQRVLDEHYRRLQRVYAEIVTNTFPTFKEVLGFYTSLPVRWKLTVLRPDSSPRIVRVFYRWFPVASWEDAGADVAFSNLAPGISDDLEVREALISMKRLTAHSSIWAGFREMPPYDGTQWNGRFDGATPVTHDMCQLLEDEIKHMFSALPANDAR